MNNEKFMYIGPTIAGVATRNSVYDGAPAALEAAVKKFPYLAALCVPIPKIAPAMKQINMGSGGIYTLYKRADSERETIRKEVI